MKNIRVAGVSWAILVLAVAAVAQKPQDFPKVELNGGLEAQMLSLGRSGNGHRPDINSAIKITNTGTSTAFIMFYGEPSAIDNAGVKFDRFKSLSGVAYCSTIPAGLCVGLPRLNEQLLFPMRGYTEIDPGKAVTLHLTIGTLAFDSKGDQISVTAQMAYRLVADMDKDAQLTEAQQFKTMRIGSLSFEPMTVTEK
jgi:hypothetical protein